MVQVIGIYIMIYRNKFLEVVNNKKYFNFISCPLFLNEIFLRFLNSFSDPGLSFSKNVFLTKNNVEPPDKTKANKRSQPKNTTLTGC